MPQRPATVRAYRPKTRALQGIAGFTRKTVRLCESKRVWRHKVANTVPVSVDRMSGFGNAGFYRDQPQWAPSGRSEWKALAENGRAAIGNGNVETEVSFIFPGLK